MNAYPRVTAVAFALLAGCSESTAVGGTPGARSQKMLRGIVVSGPLFASSGVSASGVASDSALAYVAMYPGTITEATSVRVSASSRSGGFVSGPMLDGGFDPIGVVAQPSDSLDVEALGADDAVIARVRVPASRAPTVIRSLPARGRTDVPLSQIITIVFSQPLDATTVDTTSIRLMLNGAAVPSAVTVRLDAPWVVELRPSALLSINSTYAVVIGDGIRDVSGNALVDKDSIPFTTTSEAGPATSIVVRTYEGYSRVASDIAVASPSQKVTFATANIFANGDTVVSALQSTVTWTSSDAQVATVNAVGVASALSVGRAEIEACAKTLCAHATLLVNDPAVGVSSTAIGDLGGGWSWVTDVSGDQVTGMSKGSDGTRHLFLWSRLRGIEDLGVLPFESYTESQLVNQNGTVVLSGDPVSSIWTREKGMQPLPDPDSRPGWYAEALGAQGTVVFSRWDGTSIGFWSAESGARVAVLPGKWVSPVRMNDAGQVVLFSGASDDAFRRDTLAYVWDSNTGSVVSTLLPRDFVSHYPVDIFPSSINSHGDVAGWVSSNLGAEITAFKWSASTGFRYLKTGEQNVGTRVVGLNDSGDAAVIFTTYTHGDTIRLATARGAVWTAAGDLIMLKSADPLVFPIGINNAGTVAGHTWSDVSDSQTHAQVWDVGSLIASRRKDAPVGAAKVASHVSPRVSATSSAKSSSP
jgi:Big-like domain-containing protein